MNNCTIYYDTLVGTRSREPLVILSENYRYVFQYNKTCQLPLDYYTHSNHCEAVTLLAKKVESSCTVWEECNRCN